MSAEEIDHRPMMGVHIAQVSADHRRLAYAVDRTGEEQYDLYVKEVDSGRSAQPFKLSSSTSGSMAWALDNSTLFYLTLV